MTILIVDDETDLCQLLKAMLTSNGHQVELAHTLEDGMDKVASARHDFIFLDNNLPDGFGLNYIDQLKETNPDGKLVFMTAMSNLKKDSLEKGVDYFLDKPISFKSIKQIIAQ